MSDAAEQIERRSDARRMSERILVRAPSGDDALLTARVLQQAGHEVVVLDDLSAVAREVADGVGAFLIATEALNYGDCCMSVRAVLDAQEAWSELPVVVLGGGDLKEAAVVSDLLGERAQFLILDRPLSVRTLVSAVESALRSRRRQYEVKRLLDQLAASAEEIARVHKEANRAKDEFLATLAHELRSPMTAIQGWIQMLKLGILSPDEASDALSMIETSTKVQAHIVEDLMDVSRILAGKIMIEPALIAIAPVVHSIIETFRPGAVAKNIELVSEIASEPMLVFADEARIHQIGWNLLSNAIKFTPEGGTVHVSLSYEPPNAGLRIRDSGEGISAELLPYVFDRYRQEDRLRGKAQGLGLGLAIVRHLVESHGGTIRAESAGRGRGAEFVMTLPLR